MWSYKLNVIITSPLQRKFIPFRNGMCKTKDHAKLEDVKRSLNVKVPADWYNVSENVFTT